MAALPKGANAPLNGTRVDAVLEWTESGGNAHDVDLSALLLGGDGRVGSDADFVFFNQPVHPSGAVSHKGRQGTSERLSVGVDQLPEDIDKVVLVGSITGDVFGSVKGLVLKIVDVAGGAEPLRFENMGAKTETALIVGELYKRNGTWKFRAVGQGWESGLPGLASNFGVSIEEPPDPEPGPAPAPVSHVESTRSVAPQLTYGRETPSPLDATQPSSTPAPQVPVGEPPRPLPTRQPLPLAKVAVGTPTLDEAPLTVPVRQSITLLQRGNTPQTLWLRVTHSGEDGAVPADISVLLFDEYGEPAKPVYFGEPSGLGGSIRLVVKPTSSAADDTAAVEVKLTAVDASIVGLVVVATSYEGKRLSPSRAFVTEVVSADGTSLARCDSYAPDATGTLLVMMKREVGGAWVLTTLSAPAPGRTAMSLLGAGRWALGA